MTTNENLPAPIAWLLVKAGVEDIEAPDLAVAPVDDADRVVARISREAAGARVVRIDGDLKGNDDIYVLLERGQRRWSLRCSVDADGRLTRADIERAMPEGVEVRRARREDNDAILEVCRNTPIVLGETKLTIDPGDDYFAALSLMEQAGSMVATYHGRVVAVQCGVGYEVRFAGKHQRMAQVLHTRVLPEFAGMGLFSVLRTAMSSGRWLTGRIDSSGRRSQEQEDAMRRVARAHDAARDTTAPIGTGSRDAERKPLALNNCSYFSVENEAIRRGTQVPTWNCRPYRVVVPCSPGDAAGVGRPAAKGDAGRIIAIINACHSGEELFLEYTEAFLEARLERSPVYSWADVLVSDNAVIGVWAAGQRRTIERDGVAERSTRALVLDYGFMPGAEDEFRELLQQATAVASAKGMTHLSIFTSDPSPGSSLLKDMAERVEMYDLATPLTPEPDGTLERGVYVDQIYF